MALSPQEFRISVQGLERGMFVARLDRPWIGTGFPLEGLAVGSDEDILRLQGPLREFRQVDPGSVLLDTDGLPLTIRRDLPRGAYGIDPSTLFLE